MIQPLLVFSDFGILIMRVVLGLVLVAHGLPKLKNFKGTVSGFEGMGFRPAAFWVSVAAFVEIAGGFLLILGFLTQFFAALAAVQFLVVILKLKLKPGNRFVGGYELELLIFASALAVATLGSGAFSLDNYLGLVIY